MDEWINLRFLEVKLQLFFLGVFLSPDCPKSWLNNIRINDTVMRCNDGKNDEDDDDDDD